MAALRRHLEGDLRMTFPQIFDMVNLGIAVLDKDLNICKWNQWLEMHTRIPADEIIGEKLTDHFPNLNQNWFLKNYRAVLSFGNFAFFSQKLHDYILPIKPVHHFDPAFDFMRQNCTLGPLYNENREISYVYMIIQDATEVAAYEAKLLNINTTDSLTETYNRRYFESKLKYELERHKRYVRPLSLIVIEVDRLQNINGELGHQAGDQVLMQVADLLNGRLRMVDTVARYSEDEFCVVLPETDLKAASIVADQLRKLIATTEFKYEGQPLTVTISLGVMEAMEKDMSEEALHKKVDCALQAARESSCNTVVTV